jgi:hypothetical protein
MNAYDLESQPQLQTKVGSSSSPSEVSGGEEDVHLGTIFLIAMPSHPLAPPPRFLGRAAFSPNTKSSWLTLDAAVPSGATLMATWRWKLWLSETFDQEKKSHTAVGVGPDSLKSDHGWLRQMRHWDIVMKNAAPF